jgi:hypothetical protein
MKKSVGKVNKKEVLVKVTTVWCALCNRLVTFRIIFLL